MLHVGLLNHAEPKQVRCHVTGLITLALSSLVCATFLVWLTKRCLDVTGWLQRLGCIAMRSLVDQGKDGRVHDDWLVVSSS